jgi:hypothetical protein
VDPTFDPGASIGPIGGGAEGITDLLLQGDGKVVLVGEFSQFNGVRRTGIARLNGGWITPPLVERQLPAAYVPDVPFTVRLMARPEAGVSVYAVEDQPPTNWTASSISHGGVFDARVGKVKFGPFFDHEARVLTYVVTPICGDGAGRLFAGTASADGVNSPIGGACQLRVACRLHTLRQVAPARYRLAVAGDPNDRWRVEASSDLTQWTPLATAAQGTDWIEFSDPDYAAHPQRFYRASLVE